MLDATMAFPALSSTSTGQDIENDPPVLSTSTMSNALSSGSSQSNSGVSDTPKNSPEKVVAAPAPVENVSMKTAEQEDDVRKCPKCAVPCCKRTGERLHQTTFFPCPLEPHPSSRLWAKAMGVKVIQKNMYICEDHFQLEDDLESYLKFKYYPRGQQRFPRFKKGVVPWKFSKCHGISPTTHHHRVPFSKTEFYKRQRARINRARGILSAKENQISPKGLASAPNFGCPSDLRESSDIEDVKYKSSEPVQTSKTNFNSGKEQNLEETYAKRSSGKKRKNEARKNSTSSENNYFNMLNGDISTLIAHVQPAICSWDVSEVRPEPAGNVKKAGSRNGLVESCSDVNNSGSMGLDSSESSICDSKDAQTAGMENNRETSSKGDTNPRKSTKSTLDILEASTTPAREFESSQKSDEESEDETYMTPSEDEMNGDHDTSDTDFTISSEESWGDHEFLRPTRRSARNRSQTAHRPDRYSPPVILRSRAKKRRTEGPPVVTVLEPSNSSPKRSEQSPQPNKAPETQNSDSGVTSVSSGDAELRENGKSKETTTGPTLEDGDRRNNVEARENVNTIENRLKGGIYMKSPLKGNQFEDRILIKSPLKEKQLKDGILIKSPLKENKLNVSPRKPTNNSHVENFLKKIESTEVIRAISRGTSDSESAGDPLDVSSSPKPTKSTPPKVAGTLTDAQNLDANPKWRLRASKSPIKGAKLTVDMSDTVANVFCPESQTSYSYKKVNVETIPGSSGANSRKRGKQDRFLVVRDGDQVLASPNSLPLQICGLISNMRNTLEAFFDNLDELKTDVRDHHAENPENPVDSCLTDPCIDRLLDECKKFPDLLELEMTQFAMKCEKFYDDEMDKSLKNSKKIRWCNTCQNAARFHCCFSAAYCSRICQSKDWVRHSRHCGQSRTLLDDPDLKLNPSMAHRLKSLMYSKPTIGASMSNLEELYRSSRQPTNGKRILGSKTPSKSAKRGNPSDFIDLSSGPKAMRTYYAVNRYLPTSTVASGSSNAIVPLGVSELHSAEVGDAAFKAESLDMSMEVEDGATPPRPKVMGYTLVHRNSSPTRSNADNQQVRITIPPNLLAGLPSNVRPVVNTATNRIGQSNTTTVNCAPRITSVALLPRSTSSANSSVLPKPTSPGATSSSPVTLRCRTVVLPSGETQYIPLDGQTWSFKPNAQLVVKHVNQTTAGTPVMVMKQATTSGSILITRPAKPAYSKLIPISPAPTQTVVSSIMSPHITTKEPPALPPPLTSRLPTLTPVMPKTEPTKTEPPVVRTLNSSELDKILSTDHLKEAFEQSYSSNILRP